MFKNLSKLIVETQIFFQIYRVNMQNKKKIYRVNIHKGFSNFFVVPYVKNESCFKSFFFDQSCRKPLPTVNNSCPLF